MKNKTYDELIEEKKQLIERIDFISMKLDEVISVNNILYHHFACDPNDKKQNFQILFDHAKMGNLFRILLDVTQQANDELKEVYEESARNEDEPNG